MGAEQAPPTPTPEPEKSQSKEGTEKPQVSQRGEKREQFMDPAEVAKEKAQKRRDEAKNETSTQEKAQDDLLTRIAKITADNLEKDPQLLDSLSKLYVEMDKYSHFQELPQDIMHTLMRSDAIIRGKVARYGDINPDNVNQVAPLNPNEVKNFIALIFNQLSSEALRKIPGPSTQPKPTVTVKTAEPKGRSSQPQENSAASSDLPPPKAETAKTAPVESKWQKGQFVRGEKLAKVQGVRWNSQETYKILGHKDGDPTKIILQGTDFNKTDKIEVAVVDLNKVPLPTLVVEKKKEIK